MAQATSLTWLDLQFFEAVAPLYVPAMGTDAMAPLLYSLIRFMRSRRVLECGMGYTSPFIARALRDNVEAFEQERAALRAKTSAYVAHIDELGPAGRQPRRGFTPAVGLDAIYQPKSTALADARTGWMFRDPALARPAHYLEDYRPHAYCVDTMGDAGSSAPAVLATLERLGLSSYVSVWQGDFWKVDAESLPTDAKPFDLIWIDAPLNARNAMSLLRGPHWDLIDPEGGVVVIHCLLTTEGGQLLVEELFKREQRSGRQEFELLGLLEPQRVLQNNCLILRKTSGRRPDIIDPLFTAGGDSVLEDDARRLLAR